MIKKKKVSKAAPKGKTRKKATKAPKVKAKSKSVVKAKTKKASKPSTVRARKKTVAPKKGKGLSVAELFELKKQKEQENAQANEAWKHKKNLPPQDQSHPEDMSTKGNSSKRSGFGGVRHH